MKFFLFNVTVIAALAYLFLRTAPALVPPQAIAAAVQVPEPPSPIAAPTVPTIEAVIDVPVIQPQPLREGRATPAAPLDTRPAERRAAERRKGLDQLIQDMELMAAKKLGQ
jgi:hypothetical protein